LSRRATPSERRPRSRGSARSFRPSKTRQTSFGEVGPPVRPTRSRRQTTGRTRGRSRCRTRSACLLPPTPGSTLASRRHPTVRRRTLERYYGMHRRLTHPRRGPMPRRRRRYLPGWEPTFRRSPRPCGDGDHSDHRCGPPERHPVRSCRAAARLERARGELRGRGCCRTTWPAALRAGLRSVDARSSPGGRRKPSRRWTSCCRSFAAVQVDGPFVRAKLERVEAALAAAADAGRDVADLRDLAASALQDYLQGRYDSTNRTLNDILGGCRKRFALTGRLRRRARELEVALEGLGAFLGRGLVERDAVQVHDGRGDRDAVGEHAAAGTGQVFRRHNREVAGARNAHAGRPGSPHRRARWTIAPSARSDASSSPPEQDRHLVDRTTGRLPASGAAPPRPAAPGLRPEIEGDRHGGDPPLEQDPFHASRRESPSSSRRRARPVTRIVSGAHSGTAAADPDPRQSSVRHRHEDHHSPSASVSTFLIWTLPTTVSEPGG